MEEHYILNEIVTFEENLEFEFKGFQKIEPQHRNKRIIDYSQKYINAFLNGEGGTIYLGIENDGKVTGIPLTRTQRDEIQTKISQTVGQFYPPVEPKLYRIEFLPIFVEDGKRHSDELFVIEIHVKKGAENVYWQFKEQSKAKIKLHGNVISMPPSMIVRRIRSGRDTSPITPTTHESDKQRSTQLFHNKKTIKISRPFIELTCHLPLALGRGYGEIKFKGDQERNLRIQLTREDFLGKFMIGLNTPLSQMSRPYLHQIDSDLFEVSLGNTNVHLSQDKVLDLCDCIDGVSQSYKKIVMDAEDTLQTWNYKPTEVEPGFFFGFALMRVRAELWAFMHDFSHQFDYVNGKSEWHFFHRLNTGIRFGRGNDYHALVYPIPDIYFYPQKTKSFVDLIYEVDDSRLSWETDNHKWQMSVGEKGVWTAHYTIEWIKNKFIPAVLHHYNKQIPRNLQKELQEIEDWTDKLLPFSKIKKPQDLNWHLRDIQSWFFAPSRRISANLILPYYEALIELIKFANSSDVDMGYISGKLFGSVDCDFQTENHYRNYQSIQEITKYLNQHIQNVKATGVEESRVADDISRVFVTIIEEGKFHRFGQVELNRAISIVEKLWRESRFEMRHVFPNL